MNCATVDIIALYLKTKNCHWHLARPYFGDYPVMLDEQATQHYEMIDPIAGRTPKIDGSTLRPIGHIARPR